MHNDLYCHCTDDFASTGSAGGLKPCVLLLKQMNWGQSAFRQINNDFIILGWLKIWMNKVTTVLLSKIQTIDFDFGE